MTCSVQALIACRDFVPYFEKMKEALELASSVAAPVTVRDLYTIAGRETEILDCCAFVVFGDEFMKNETSFIASAFARVMCTLVGKNSLLKEEKVIFVHHGEIVILQTLCDCFDIEIEGMMTTVGDRYAYFSLTRNFVRSRRRKNIRKRLNEFQ